MAARAFLPMASLPELRAAKTALWKAVAAELERQGVDDVPATLTESDELHAAWRHPDLLFSQTCGYPFVLGLDRHVQLVATPLYGVEGCSGPNYCSAIVVRADDPAERLADLRGRVCVYNNPDSQSGYNALRLEVSRIAGGQRFFGAVLESGGHLASAEQIAGGRADVAAIDCVAYAAMGRHRPELAGSLKVIGFTASSPGLPFITSRRTSADVLQALRAALDAVLADPSLGAVREALFLTGVEQLSPSDYAIMLEMQREAAARGYPELR